VGVPAGPYEVLEGKGESKGDEGEAQDGEEEDVRDGVEMVDEADEVDMEMA